MDTKQILKILKKESKKYQLPLAQEIGRTKDPFKVLISTILSPRARDDQTAKVCKILFKVADTPEKTAKLTIKKLEKIVYSIGFYKTKAKRVKQASEHLLKHHKGKVPKKYEDLIKIPGVGRKVANIVLAECFNQAVIAVDIHAHRIPNRLGILKTKNPLETEKKLMKLFPKKDWRIMNRLLVVWGQNVCTPISPFCSKCKLIKHCKRVGVENSR